VRDVAVENYAGRKRRRRSDNNNIGNISNSRSNIEAEINGGR